MEYMKLVIQSESNRKKKISTETVSYTLFVSLSSDNERKSEMGSTNIRLKIMLSCV